MSTSLIPHFLILHLLFHRIVHNINRGDDGRPKNCWVGGVERGRQSSQNAKIGIVEYLRNLMEGAKKKYNTSQQTTLIGRTFFDKLIAGGISKKKAEEYTYNIIGAFTTVKKKDNEKKKKDNESDQKKEDNGNDQKKKKKDPKDPLKTETIKVQDCEIQFIDNLIQKIIGGYTPNKKDFDFLQKNRSVDNALFGRMLAVRPQYEVEAATAVAHGFTVNESFIVEDYFTATETLQKKNGNRGSAHLDKAFFSEGVFYNNYILDLHLLIENLQGNTEVAEEVIRDFLKVSAMLSPKASKNRAAGSQTWASYMMIEKCSEFPRQLGVAFEKPVQGPGVMEKAIEALEEAKKGFDKIYYELPAKSFNHVKSKGSLKEVIDFAVEDF